MLFIKTYHVYFYFTICVFQHTVVCQRLIPIIPLFSYIGTTVYYQFYISVHLHGNVVAQKGAYTLTILSL